MSASIMKPLPASQLHLAKPSTGVVDSNWKPVYWVGGVSALLMIVTIVAAISVFIVSPPPTTVLNWFTLFHENGLLGLLDMDLLMLVGIALSGLIYIALYGALRQSNQPIMLLGMIIGLVGITTYLSSNTAFNMLSLSSQYAAASTDAERAQLLGAGKAMLAIWQGSAYDVGYVLGGIAMLIIAVVMLRSAVFSKATGWVGLLVGVLMLIPATAGTVGLVFSLLSLVPTMIWSILIAHRLFQLARDVSPKEAQGVSANSSGHGYMPTGDDLAPTIHGGD